MRTSLFVAPVALLISGVASAQSTLPTVEVRGGTLESVSVPCANPASVKPADVERVLSIENSDMTRRMRKELISAVTDACKAGIPHIVVSRDAHDLSWKKAVD